MTIIVSMSSGDLHFAYAMTVDDLEGRLYTSSFRNPISKLTVEGNYTKVNVIASKYPLRRELATTRYSNWSMTHLTQWTFDRWPMRPTTHCRLLSKRQCSYRSTPRANISSGGSTWAARGWGWLAPIECLAPPVVSLMGSYTYYYKPIDKWLGPPPCIRSFHPSAPPHLVNPGAAIEYF